MVSSPVNIFIIICMSTSSHIRQNNVQYLKKASPRKSLNLTVSPKVTSRSGNYLSDEDDSQLDQEDLLKLQIRQIKRQNKFLKKKLKDLLNELEGDQPKKKKLVSKGPVPQNKDPTHQTIQFFFESINTLLNSLINLYKIEFTAEQIEKFTLKHPDGDQIVNPVRRYIAIKKYSLNRKLEKVILSEQEKRYPQLLDIFENYYKAKNDCDNFLNKYVQNLCEKAIELNKVVLQKAQQKSAIKSSRIKSHHSLNNSEVGDITIPPLTFSYIYGKNNVEIRTKNRSRNYNSALEKE